MKDAGHRFLPQYVGHRGSSPAQPMRESGDVLLVQKLRNAVLPQSVGREGVNSANNASAVLVDHEMSRIPFSTQRQPVRALSSDRNVSLAGSATCGALKLTCPLAPIS
jgi:hypothetical protein